METLVLKTTDYVGLAPASFFFQAEDGIRDDLVTGVQTCALPIYRRPSPGERQREDQGNEQGACTRRHTEGRVRPRGGRTAQEVERQRSAFRRLGDLPREGLRGGSRTALRVTDQRLVRPDHPEVG